MKNKTKGLAMTIAVLGSTGAAMAAVDWIGTTGNWTNGANWSSTPNIPAATDVVEINGGNAVVTIDSDVGTFAKLQTGDTSGGGTDTINVEVGGAIVSSQHRQANVAGTTSILNINGGSFTYVAGNSAFGYGGTGIVNVNSGSMVSASDLDFGRNAGSHGELNVSGGLVDVGANLLLAQNNASTTASMDVSGGTVQVTGTLDVGFTGVATANLTGGSVDSAVTRVGGSAQGGSGTLTVNADGLLTTDRFVVGGDTGTGVANLDGGTVNAGVFDIGQNGTLNLSSAVALGSTNMAFVADGLLVWEGDRTTDVADLFASGELAGTGGLVDISTLVLGTDYDAVYGSGADLLVSKYDAETGNTSVYTVIPEPATLGLVAAMGASMLFFRRVFRV